MCGAPSDVRFLLCCTLKCFTKPVFSAVTCLLGIYPVWRPWQAVSMLLRCLCLCYGWGAEVVACGMFKAQGMDYYFATAHLALLLCNGKKDRSFVTVQTKKRTFFSSLFRSVCRSQFFQ